MPTITAFVDEEFPLTGTAGVNLYDNDTEARLRPGHTVAATTGNGKYIYTKAHAAIAAAGAVAIAAGGATTAAGTGYTAVRAMAINTFGWIKSNTAASA